MAKPHDPKQPCFEDCLGELEQIVAQLEAGEKPLDESLALYEKGVAALKRCHEMLDKAEQRIRLLVRGPGGAPLLKEAEIQPAAGTVARNAAPVSPDDLDIEEETETEIEEPPAPPPPEKRPAAKPSSRRGGPNTLFAGDQ
ncbi:MAG TPA: exodeoxyribonuclease VII small subunit [Planctomycetota bacterium]|nr:exodeoxyribonuclease VII small subunit [Planctomycetota bacterium]